LLVAILNEYVDHSSEILALLLIFL